MSLLARVKERADTAAWSQFTALYRPLLVRYARSWGLQPVDADDLAQECLVELMRRMPAFEYDRCRGGFRRWLRVFVSYRIRNHLRKRREPSGRTGDFERPQQRERGPVEAWDRIWLQEHLKYCLDRIRPDFEPRTFNAFRHAVIQEWPIPRVCETLGMNANQVYIAKSRVAGRLRETMVGLLGDAV